MDVGDGWVSLDHSSKGFADVVFYGQEYTLLLFNILLYAIVDYGADNSVVAAFVTFAVQWLLDIARDYFGQKNLSRKTLVDERFLI